MWKFADPGVRQRSNSGKPFPSNAILKGPSRTNISCRAKGPPIFIVYDVIQLLMSMTLLKTFTSFLLQSSIQRTLHLQLLVGPLYKRNPHRKWLPACESCPRSSAEYQLFLIELDSSFPMPLWQLSASCRQESQDFPMSDPQRNTPVKHFMSVRRAACAIGYVKKIIDSRVSARAEHFVGQKVLPAW